jgi:hypothetical protein
VPLGHLYSCFGDLMLNTNALNAYVLNEQEVQIKDKVYF